MYRLSLHTKGNDINGKYSKSKENIPKLVKIIKEVNSVASLQSRFSSDDLGLHFPVSPVTFGHV
jgi:hypothetical protein